MRYLLLAVLLVGCTSAQTTIAPTMDDSPASVAPTAATSPSVDQAAVDETRALVRAGVRNASRELEGWERRVILQRDHAITQQYESALVAIGEEMADWIEEQRDELADAATGPCINDALAAYELALDELETTTERLFEPQSADARVVRALAALEDAGEALDAAADALPPSCDA